jgi:hypothetical protein
MLWSSQRLLLHCFQYNRPEMPDSAYTPARCHGTIRKKRVRAAGGRSRKEEQHRGALYPDTGRNERARGVAAERARKQVISWVHKLASALSYSWAYKLEERYEEQVEILGSPRSAGLSCWSCSERRSRTGRSRARHSHTCHTKKRMRMNKRARKCGYKRFSQHNKGTIAGITFRIRSRDQP